MWWKEMNLSTTFCGGCDMKIYTSYFANMKRIKEKFPNVFFISIAAKKPDYIDIMEYKKLAPKFSFWKIWKNNISKKGINDYYIAEYQKQVLSLLNPKIVLYELEKMTSKSEMVVLLCYEKPKDFCHRHIVADWITKNTNTKIKELNLGDETNES